MEPAARRRVPPLLLLLLLRYLLATGSYEFRVLAGPLAVLVVAGLPFLGRRRQRGRQEGGRHGGQLGLFFGTQRFDETRRDHHQEFIVGFLCAAAAEEFAQNGYVAESGNLVHGLHDLVVDQAGDGETLAILENHFGFDAALGQGGNHKSLQRDRVGEVQAADFGRDFEIDGALRRNRRCEIELHAVGFELHRDHWRGGAAGGRSGDRRERKTAAGEETGVLALEREQIRLGENLQQILFLQSLDRRADVEIRDEREEVEQIGEVDGLPSAWCQLADARRSELLRGANARQLRRVAEP